MIPGTTKKGICRLHAEEYVNTTTRSNMLDKSNSKSRLFILGQVHIKSKVMNTDERMNEKQTILNCKVQVL